MLMGKHDRLQRWAVGGYTQRRGSCRVQRLQFWKTAAVRLPPEEGQGEGEGEREEVGGGPIGRPGLGTSPPGLEGRLTLSPSPVPEYRAALPASCVPTWMRLLPSEAVSSLSSSVGGPHGRHPCPLTGGSAQGWGLEQPGAPG